MSFGAAPRRMQRTAAGRRHRARVRKLALAIIAVLSLPLAGCGHAAPDSDGGPDVGTDADTCAGADGGVHDGCAGIDAGELPDASPDASADAGPGPDGGTEPACDRDFHVASSGRSGAAGSLDDPWSTVGDVNGADLQPGDCVWFRRGDTWSESLTPPSSGAPDRPIVFGGYGTGAPPRLTGEGDRSCVGWVGPRSHLVFRDLHLQGCGLPGGGNAGGISVWSEGGTSRDLVVQGLLIEGAQTWGIYMSGVSGLTIRGTTIRGSEEQHGIYLDGTLGLEDAVIEGCEIHHNNEMCVQLNSNGHSRLTGVVLRYNRLHDCGAGGVNNIGADGLVAHHNLIHGEMPGIYNGCDGADDGCRAGAVDGVYANNTIHTLGSGWAACFSNASSVGAPGFASFVNNICVHDAGSGVALENAGAGGSVTNHNLYFSNVSSSVPFEWEGAWYDDFAAFQAGTGNDADGAFADPELRDAAAAAYELLASSPAVNTAVDLGFTRDIVGTAVPSGSAPDRGAFERP